MPESVAAAVDQPPPADEGEPVGPSAGEEESFLLEQRAADPTAAGGTGNDVPASESAEVGELPALDELVQQIPAPTRALINELFRAKFVTVRRVPAAAIKSKS